VGLPLVGALPFLFRNQLAQAVAAREKYGDIYNLKLGTMSCIALNHPRHAQHLLRDNAHAYGKGGPMWDFVREFVGNGLPTSEGEFWRRQRRMLQPQFIKERVNGLAGLIVNAIDETLEVWHQAAASGEPFKVSEAIARTTMNVIVKAMFGADISSEEAKIVNDELHYAFGFQAAKMLSGALPSWVPIPGSRRFDRAIGVIDGIVYRLIERRRSRGSEGAGGDYIGLMLAAVDDETGARMTNEQLRDEAIAIFIAGYETTSTFLSFACGELAKNPQVAQALYAECDTVLGQATPTVAHLQRMPQLYMTIHEVLRLYPSAYWLPRTSEEEDVIDGFRIPKGTLVVLMTYVLHRHPEFWPEPERFDPWRFTPERSAGRHPLAWIPFGTGQRQCIGKDFALLEAQLILCRLLSSFEFELSPHHEIQAELAATLRPRNGMWLQVSKRTPAKSRMSAMG
jgi:cytochrome P450